MQHSAGQRGFTLLEVLVVLIIVSMVSGIVFQAFEITLRLNRRFGLEQANSQQGAMLADWFRQSIRGLQPDYTEGKSIFKGGEKRISGLSTNTLAADYGVPAALVWELAFDPDRGETSLRYGTGDNSAPLISWPGTAGRFVYFDAKGEAHDSWPPPLGMWPQLPAAIRLEAARGSEPYVIVATPLGPARRPARPKDFFFEGGK